MVKKTFLVLICFIGLIFFISTLHGQGSKKTITLPSGEVVCDLNGEWDLVWIGPVGRVVDVYKITQQGNSFEGIRIIGNAYNAKGTVAIKGELDKNGFKELMYYAPNQEGSYKGKISEDGNLIEFDSNEAHIELTRK